MFRKVQNLRDSKRCRSKRAGSKRCRSKRTGLSIVSSSFQNVGGKDRHAEFLRDFDARRLNPFENTFVTAEGGLQRFIARSMPTRPCSIFLPARDLRNRGSWDLLHKDITQASIALARMPFGSPKQQGPHTDVTFDEQTKSLTPISKIKRGLERIKGTKRTGVVLVNWGEFNPIHLANIHLFECARKMLEERTSFAVVGGFICPARDKLVQLKCRSDVNEAIPCCHRARMCEAMVQSSSWIDVDRWEVTRRAGVYDNLSALEHVRDYLAWSIPDEHIHVMYVSGIDDLVKCTEKTLTIFGCICVCRFDEKWAIKRGNHIARRFPDRVFIVEDDQMINHQLLDLTAAQIRTWITEGKDVSELVGPDVMAYMREHSILSKLRKRSWLQSDRKVKPLLRSMLEEKFSRDQDLTLERGSGGKKCGDANTANLTAETSKESVNMINLEYPRSRSNASGFDVPNNQVSSAGGTSTMYPWVEKFLSNY